MSRTWLLWVVALGSTEAYAVAGSRASNLSEQQIVSGEALPWTVPSSSTLVTEDEAFGSDDEMRAFVDPLAALAEPGERLLRLREALESHGLFAIDYRNEFTRTARATFHEHEGNCLSFTMLFVALARAAGLDATYNVVDVPPTFDSERGQVVVGRHVNALVQVSADRQFVVDFNEPNYREKYPARPVSDRYAVALFYSNLGAEALVREQYGSSFASLRKATSVASDVPGAWVNLAVLYSRLGRYDYAEAADLRALLADPMDQSALVNLISVYTSLGERRLAAAYRQRTRAYRNANPYYHFAVGQTAYDQKRYKDALRALRAAIRLKPNDEFYRLQGRALTALGREARAAESFRRAGTTAGPR